MTKVSQLTKMLTVLTSEVKSGQSSCGQENAYLPKRMQKSFLDMLIQLPSYGHFKISICPQRANLTSEVKFDLGG